jgi:hypothetical protein
LPTRRFYLLYPWRWCGVLNINSSTMALSKSRMSLNGWHIHVVTFVTLMQLVLLIFCTYMAYVPSLSTAV